MLKFLRHAFLGNDPLISHVLTRATLRTHSARLPRYVPRTVSPVQPLDAAAGPEVVGQRILGRMSVAAPTVTDAIKQLAATAVNNEPFFLLDIGDVYRKHQVWSKSLPRVAPFYAVKCNSDPMVLRALAALGTGFDCASLVEMQTMLEIGADAKKIIYAHPCKPPSHIRYAQEQGVELMTFDNIDELIKIKSIYADAKYVVLSVCDAWTDGMQARSARAHGRQQGSVQGSLAVMCV